MSEPPSSTASLLARAKKGDDTALSELLERYREPLVRLLRGRLSPASRSLLDTTDVVQEVLSAALEQLGHVEYRGLGSFWFYLRRIGLNRVLEADRRQGARPREAHDSALLEAAARDSGAEPLGALEREETSAAIDAALERLPEPTRGAVLLRLELALPYGVIARECGYPSEDAARMAIARGIARVSQELDGFAP